MVMPGYWWWLCVSDGNVCGETDVCGDAWVLVVMLCCCCVKGPAHSHTCWHTCMTNTCMKLSLTV